MDKRGRVEEKEMAEGLRAKRGRKLPWDCFIRDPGLIALSALFYVSTMKTIEVKDCLTKADIEQWYRQMCSKTYLINEVTIRINKAVKERVN